MSRLNITLSAQPNPDFDSASHQGSVRIEPQEVPILSLGLAIQVFAAFVRNNDLGAGNLGGRSGLVRQDSTLLCRVSINGNGKFWAVDETGRETSQRYTRPRLSDLEQIVRFLREAAGLTRNEMSDGTGVSVSTIRNLEKARHTASMWTWHQLLGHESMRNFSRIAAESGLAMPDVRNPHDPDPGSGSGTPGAGLGGTVGTGDGGESGGASGSGGTP